VRLAAHVWKLSALRSSQMDFDTEQLSLSEVKSMIRKLRYLFGIFLALDLIVIGFLLYHSWESKVPDNMYSFVGEEGNISLPEIFSAEETKETLKVTASEDGFSMVSGKTGDYSVSVRLFGIVPVKQVSVHVIEKMEVAPSGEPIGIYVSTKGLLVLDNTEFEGKDGLTYSPGANIIKTGDYILKWNGKSVATIQQLKEKIQKSGRERATVLIRRGTEEIKVAIRPVLASDGEYKIGAWVREDTQGIGTLTYIAKDGTFGTLGHGITDVDTGVLLDLKGGELYRTKILGITKGSSGEPGELQGYINMVAANEIGNIESNTELGVFGKMNEDEADEYADNWMPIALKQDIQTGKAWIYSNLDGTSPQKYEIQIEEINLASRDNKSMLIRITDEKLLELTGGIVQGMSGSPILQNGKIIGAVTHVLVDDPTRGYGVFIENMLGA
jgi:stage IV sporulation protein B